MLHTDKKLLKGFRKGETEAFETVYHLYADLVRKFFTLASVFPAKVVPAAFMVQTAPSMLMQLYKKHFFAPLVKPPEKVTMVSDLFKTISFPLHVT